MGMKGIVVAQCPAKPTGQIADLLFEAGQAMSPRTNNDPCTLFGKSDGGMVALLETAYIHGQHNSQ